MKKVYILLFFSAQIAYGQGNPYDSLNLQLAAARADTQKLLIIKQLADIAFRNDIHKALEFSRQGVQLAEKAGDKNWQPQFYEMEGRMHANLLDLDSASIFFAKAMAGYVAVNNKKGQATTSFKIGWICKKKGEIDKALAADIKASVLMEQIDDKEGMAGAYERICEDLTSQGRYAEAMNYAQKAIDVCTDNHLDDEMPHALTMGGYVTIAENKYHEAFNYFDLALKLARKQDFSPVILCDFLNNRGNALKRLARYPEALKDYEEALAAAKRSNYANAVSATIANLGEVNLLMGNYKNALPFQLETVRMQEESHDLSNLTENYLHVSTIYEHLGDFKSALAYQKKALMMRDSVASVKSDEAMTDMLTKYETQKKEATILSQQKEIAAQRKTAWLASGLAFLMAAFIIFGIISYRIRNKRSRLLAVKNAENELLLKEIHHRVKNNLEVVSSLLLLQSSQIEDQSTKEAMLEGQSRVHSIGIVHQKLYQGINPGAIEMKDYFSNLSESILSAFGAEHRVKVELPMQNLDVDIDIAVPLGLIVNELLTNTLKYAFPGGGKGKISIRLEKRKDHILHLAVSDNGIGKRKVIQGSGFGSQLISLLTTQLNGKMREEIQNGTTVFFDFKMDKVA